MQYVGIHKDQKLIVMFINWRCGMVIKTNQPFYNPGEVLEFQPCDNKAVWKRIKYTLEFHEY